MCVQTQRSSEEAFHFFGRNLTVLGRSLRICGRILPICGVAVPRMHFGKTFRMSLLCLTKWWTEKNPSDQLRITDLWACPGTPKWGRSLSSSTTNGLALEEPTTASCAFAHTPIIPLLGSSPRTNTYSVPPILPLSTTPNTPTTCSSPLTPRHKFYPLSFMHLRSLPVVCPIIPKSLLNPCDWLPIQTVTSESFTRTTKCSTFWHVTSFAYSLLSELHRNSSRWIPYMGWLWVVQVGPTCIHRGIW